jgi:hypothetical protein
MAKQTYQQQMQEKIQRAQMGHKEVEGDVLYTFENHRNHDLSLPRKSFDDKKIIPPRGRFKGDSYFLMLMKTGYVRLVSSEPYIRPGAHPPAVIETKVETKTVCAVCGCQTPATVPTENVTSTKLNENIQESVTMEKLILDQPEKYTTQGHSEHVVNEAPKKVNEQFPQEGKNKDVLLTESPLDGIDIIRG